MLGGMFLVYVLLIGALQAPTPAEELSNEEKEEASKYLTLKANKKMIQDKMAASTGKAIILKDLSNLSTRLKCSNTRNDLSSAVQQLSEKHGKFGPLHPDIPLYETLGKMN